MAKKHTDKEKLTDYLKKHDVMRRWGMVMMVVALLVTTVTLYALNKAASAVTEEGAEEVGMVLNINTSDSNSDGESTESGSDDGSTDSESDDSTSDAGENDNSSEDNNSDAGSGDDNGSNDSSDENADSDNTESSEDTGSDDGDSGQDTGSENASDNTGDDSSDSNTDDSSDTGSSNESPESVNTNQSDSSDGDSSEGDSSDAAQDASSTEETDEEDTEEDEEEDEDKDKKEEDKDKEDKDEITKDVVLTVSYLDEDGYLVTDQDGNAVSDSKELNISDSMDISTEAPEVEGYTFVKATYEGKSIDTITVRKYTASDENEYRYYELGRSGADSIEVKADAEVRFIYKASDEKKQEKRKKIVIDNVKITGLYKDTDDNVIAENSELVTTDMMDLTNKENITQIDGFFFDKAVYDGKKIVSIKAVEKEITTEMIQKAIEEGKAEDISEEESSSEENSAEAESSSDSESESSEASSEQSETSDDAGKNVVILKEDEEGNTTVEEGSATTYAAYEVVTADDERIELTEDAEINFVYLKANTQESFEVSNDRVTVTAKLSNPAALPEGVALSVKELNAETEGYNYNAYLQAMNNNAEAIAQASGQTEAQTYSENNTLLYDIAFMLDGVEYKLAEGTVTVSMKLNNNQISEDLGAQNAEEVTVVHMPVSEEIMQNVDTTGDATDISANDITVEVLSDSNIELGQNEDTVEFETGSFSVFAMTSSVSEYTWTGIGLGNNNTADWVVNSLGNAVYFGVVADTFAANGVDFESNVAINNLTNYTNYTFYNYDRGELDFSDRRTYKVRVYKRASKPGTYNFALYDDKDAQTAPTYTFSIDAQTYSGGYYVGEHYLDGIALGKLNKYVYEVNVTKDASGNDVYTPIKEGDICTVTTADGEESAFTVTYTESSYISNEKGNDLLKTLSGSFVTNWERNYYSDYDAKMVLSEGCTLSYKTDNSSYETITKIGGELDKKTYNGTFPVDVNAMLGSAAEVSKALAGAIDCNSLEIVNVRAKTGDYYLDFKNAYGSNLDQNAAIQEVVQVDDGKILVINLDLTNYDTYSLGDRSFWINRKLAAYLSYDELGARVIINPLQLVGNQFVPYTGTLNITSMVGTVIAPYATVNEYGLYGAVIAKNVNHAGGEIHRMTLLRYSDEILSVTAINSLTDDENLEFNVTKVINGVPATEADTGKFQFSLDMLDPERRQGWINVKTVSNEGSNVTFRVSPAFLNMQYGDGQNDNSGHTYYFRITENDISNTYSSSYTKDDTAILVKVKYYEGGETNYYRISAGELEYISSHPGIGYYNNEHRIDASKDTDQLKYVAFNNKTAETVDIEVTKAWVLNGQGEDKIPNIFAARVGADVVLQLYADGRSIPPYECTPSITVSSNPKEKVEKADVAWIYKWSKLPKYDSQGSLIKYTVAETTVPTGFTTDTPTDKPITIEYSDEEYHDSETGSETLGLGTIINTGTSLKLTLYKYEDNKLAKHSYEFWMRMARDDSDAWSNSSSGAVLYNETSGDKKGVIEYTIDPADWGMEAGHTYYLRFNEPYGDKDGNYGYPYRDKGIVIAKITYNGVNDIAINYYRIDQSVTDDRVPETIGRYNIGKSVAVYGVYAQPLAVALVKEYCKPENEVTGDKVAFYNSKTENINITVVKEWDELVGQAKNEKAVADSIWDVTFKLLRRPKDSNGNWELAEEYTIRTPNIYQESEGADFEGDLCDYPEDWTYKSKEITFNNLSSQYEYKIEEYYGSEQLNPESYVHSAGYTDSGTANTVNGFKLEKVTEEVDSEGNIKFTLHNTPYIQLNKYWKMNGNIVSTEDAKQLGFGSVYVKLYRNHRADKTYVQLTKNELSKGSSQYVIETAHGAIIELSSGNDWYAEFALDRKWDNAPGQTHVYQYVYMMVECDREGNEIAETPYVTYGSVNTSNVTRTGSDYNYVRGFKDKIKTDKTNWEDAWVSGNNYPICKLNVTNSRDGFTLPESGGMGKLPFTIGGLLLATAALIGEEYIRRKRRKYHK